MSVSDRGVAAGVGIAQTRVVSFFHGVEGKDLFSF